MRTPASTRLRRGLTVVAATTAVLLLGAACSSATDPSDPAAHQHSSMPGMDMAPGADRVGLSATSPGGYRFVPAATSVPPGQPTDFRFQILGPDGKPVTRYETDQTKLLHLYVIRTDLTGFQHVHPALDPDGTWTAPLQSLTPGSYRVYPQFTVLPADGPGVPLVLGQQLTVPGPAAVDTALPAAAASTQVDGYTLALDGHAAAGADAELNVTVTKDGQPVTDLQPYLDTYAHLTAFHEGDLAFAHLHPSGAVDGDRGGPRLSFHATLPEPGNYRLFLQFQTADTVHTATVTLPTT